MAFKNFRYDNAMRRVETTPEPTDQKFAKGSRVWIRELPLYMAHFPGEQYATVRYTHSHAYGDEDVKHYCLDIDGHGDVAWYKECQLDAVRKPKERKWKNKLKDEEMTDIIMACLERAVFRRIKADRTSELHEVEQAIKLKEYWRI